MNRKVSFIFLVPTDSLTVSLQDIFDDIEDGKVTIEDYEQYHPKDITAQLVESEAGERCLEFNIFHQN